jgi:hypothetical protein
MKYSKGIAVHNEVRGAQADFSTRRAAAGTCRALGIRRARTVTGLKRPHSTRSPVYFGRWSKSGCQRVTAGQFRALLAWPALPSGSAPFHACSAAARASPLKVRHRLLCHRWFPAHRKGRPWLLNHSRPYLLFLIFTATLGPSTELGSCFNPACPSCLGGVCPGTPKTYPAPTPHRK